MEKIPFIFCGNTNKVWHFFAISLEFEAHQVTNLFFKKFLSYMVFLKLLSVIVIVNFSFIFGGFILFESYKNYF